MLLLPPIFQKLRLHSGTTCVAYFHPSRRPPGPPLLHCHACVYSRVPVAATLGNSDREPAAVRQPPSQAFARPHLFCVVDITRGPNLHRQGIPTPRVTPWASSHLGRIAFCSQRRFLRSPLSQATHDVIMHAAATMLLREDATVPVRTSPPSNLTPPAPHGQPSRTVPFRSRAPHDAPAANPGSESIPAASGGEQPP